MFAAGCSAAWLARHVRDVEAGSSNLLTPTNTGQETQGHLAGSSISCLDGLQFDREGPRRGEVTQYRGRDLVL